MTFFSVSFLRSIGIHGSENFYFFIKLKFGVNFFIYTSEQHFSLCLGLNAHTRLLANFSQH